MEITFESPDKKHSYTIKLGQLKTEWPLWLLNEEGEGMSVSSAIIFQLLDEYFKSEF